MGMALPWPFGRSGMLKKNSRCKRNHAKIFNRSPVIILKRKKGVALTRPFSFLGSPATNMLDKISKIILDHCLLDAKGIMQKYSTVLL